MQRWTKSRVIKGLKVRAQVGAPLNYAAVVASDEPLAGAALRLWGSWDEALTAAGMDPDTIKRPRVDVAPPGTWSRTVVLERAKARQAAGLSMAAHHVQSEVSDLYSAAVAYLGSWGEVCRALGLDYESEVRLRREWTAETIVARLGELAEAGAELSVRNLEAFDAGFLSAAIAEFGTWTAALDAAGLDESRRTTSWSRPRILEAIQAGVVNNHPASGGLRVAAERVFGSWEAAVAIALPRQEVTSTLRVVRTGAKVSQAELGRRVGRSHRWVGLVESGVIVPDLAMALRLATTLKTSVEALFAVNGDGEAPRE